MTAPRVLVREDANRVRGGSEPAPELGWYLLGGLGLAFAVVGGLDILLAWFPTNFGNSEWKFGTVTTTLASFPLFSMGLILLTVSGVGRGRRWLIGTMVGILALVVLLIVWWAVLYLPEVSSGLASVTDPATKMGLRRAVMKTRTQLVIYPVILGWIAVIAWKRWRST